ncbi:imidazole glycerol phosphate synthase subunit HisH [Turneriella parva]|nr:imidazole glycerol phosphate synthase subunit HisH [Turneriella parva]
MSKNPRIALLDYGMGNIRSLQKAFEHLGATAKVTGDPREVEAADVLLLPGDGAFVRAMDNLRSRGLIDAIYGAHQKQKIIFGICIGFQLLFESSTEFTGAKGLGLVKGAITRLEKNAEAPAIPHIGWTTTEFKAKSRLGRGIHPHSMFYYVHSYAHRAEHMYAKATTSYGQMFTSVLEHENLFAAQFHPEKSHNAGLKLLANFLEAL